MVKRTTIHVSSRTKMNHPKKWRVRIITKDKKGNEKKNNKYNLYNILQPSYPLQESWLQYCPREAVVLVVYLAARLLKAKRCSSL